MSEVKPEVKSDVPKPEEVQWQARRKRRHEDGPSLHRQEQYLAVIDGRIKDFDEKIPSCKSELNDYIKDAKFAAFDVKLLKKRQRKANDKIARIEAELKEAKEDLNDAVRLMRIARDDLYFMQDKASMLRDKYMRMIEDRAIYQELYDSTFNRIDGAPSRQQALLLKPFVEPIADADTEDDLSDSDDDETVPPSPNSYFVPSTPDYEV